MKVVIDQNPLAPSHLSLAAAREAAPAWITPATVPSPPEMTAYRLRFHLPQAERLRVHVSADERYHLFVDGQAVGRGPERGSDRIWFYDTYDLALESGDHVFVALVWRLGAIGPMAQISLAGGFLLQADPPFDALLSTRAAAWEARPVEGLRFSQPDPHGADGAWFVGPNQTIEGALYPWGIEQGNGAGWMPAVQRDEAGGFPFGLQPSHLLEPASLPAQFSASRTGGQVRHVASGTWRHAQAIPVDGSAHLPAEAEAWQNLIDGQASLTIPPQARRQVVIELDDYLCAYPQMRLSGGKGSCVIVGWAEALHADPLGSRKGQRDQVDGQIFLAVSRDEFRTDGGAGRQFEPLWWRAGRFVEILVESDAEPLTIESWALVETRYPLEMESRFGSSDARLQDILPLALRGLQMCAHETYLDCPYYEQLMYVGDARLEALTTYTISTDDRLPRKAIRLFGLSRGPGGFTAARYPSREAQIIPPFSLWWIGMVYDFALWRGDRAFVKSQLPGVRAVLDAFLDQIASNGLLQAFAGWNFADWVADWPMGVPPDGLTGFSGLFNWHLVYTLGLAAQLEEWVGDSQVAQRWQSSQTKLEASAVAAFWDESRGLFADDLDHRHFSEHTQSLALLSRTLDPTRVGRVGQNLRRDPGLTRTTIYFTHYLFEAYRLLQDPTAFLERMELWFDLPNRAFKTTPESPEPTRSDCHGWGSHPIYHYFATLAGIRPASFGFQSVDIAPQPGSLSTLSGAMVHPLGPIMASLSFEAEHVQGRVTLPRGLEGTFRWKGKTLRLRPGEQSIAL